MHPIRCRPQEVDYLLMVKSDECSDCTNQDERNIIPWLNCVSVFKTRWLPTDKTIRAGTRTSTESISANRKPLSSKVPRLRLVLGWVFVHQVNVEVPSPRPK